MDEALQTHLLNLVTHLHQNSGQKVSLVGWSLGGLYARELAKALPRLIEASLGKATPQEQKLNAEIEKLERVIFHLEPES